MNLLFSFWSNNIAIKIKYDEPHLGFVDPIINLSKLVETWTSGSSKKDKSLKNGLQRMDSIHVVPDFYSCNHNHLDIRSRAKSSRRYDI